MAIGYTRLFLRIQNSPNSDYTDPDKNDLLTITLGQLYRTIMVIEKSFTTAESLPTIATNASNMLVIQNLSSTVTLAVSVVPNGDAARIFTVPVSGAAIFPGVDVGACTIGGTANASATARVYVFATTDTAS